MLQQIATRVFMGASLVFGVVGVLFVLTLPENDNDMSGLSLILQRLLLVCVFVILSSFAFSVAAKYLNGKS